MDNKDKIEVVRYDKVRKKKIFQANHIYGNNKYNYIEQEREKRREIARIELEKKNKRLAPVRKEIKNLFENIANMSKIPFKIKLSYFGLKSKNFSNNVCKKIIKNNILLPSCNKIYNIFYNYVFPYKFACAIEIAKENNYVPSLIKEFINKFYTPYLINEKLNICEDEFIKIQSKNIIDIPHNIMNKRMLERFLIKEPEYTIDFIGIIMKFNNLKKLRLEHVFMDANDY